MRYREYLEGRGRVSRATMYRRQQEQIERGYSDSSSEDENWRVSHEITF